MEISEKSVGEIGIEACYAGYWNIPPIMVHGTNAVCKEAMEFFPGVITADVKHAAMTYVPDLMLIQRIVLLLRKLGKPLIKHEIDELTHINLRYQ
jgi:D-aminopeptidase